VAKFKLAVGRPLKQLSSLDYLVLSELIRDAKTSDRQIAKKLGVSQPTVTRRRAKLEKELSLRYTAVPMWQKLGFELIAFTFARWNRNAFSDEKTLKTMGFLLKHPNVIFASAGRGIGLDRVCVSIHESYRDYIRLLQEIRFQLGKYLAELDSFVISFGGDAILRPITTRFLADYLVARKATDASSDAVSPSLFSVEQH
jgi:DNA-binding Lrp family transcriptional regulator